MECDFNGINYNQKTLVCQNFLRSWKSIFPFNAMFVDNKV
jgi:hypothetical protein